nr:hypothetical protein [Micromonospora sp. DSM 115978]
MAAKDRGQRGGGYASIGKPVPVAPHQIAAHFLVDAARYREAIMFRIPWFRPRRDTGPVPTKLRHRRDWSRWGRWCSCGLRWRGCPDRPDSPIEERWRARLDERGRAAPEDRSTALADGGTRWAYPVREMVTGLPPRPPRVPPTNRGGAGRWTVRDGRTNLGPGDPGTTRAAGQRPVVR